MQERGRQQIQETAGLVLKKERACKSRTVYYYGEIIYLHYFRLRFCSSVIVVTEI